jgi:hypothetical protein
MTSKQRIAKLEKQKPQAAQVINIWRVFIEADEETMSRYDRQQKARGGMTWADFIAKAEDKPTAKP